MNFFIGQRVRKVIGLNVGHEGVVVGLGMYQPGTLPNGSRISKPSDIQVRYWQPWVSESGHTWGLEVTAYGLAYKFEPILPSGHQPAEVDVHELLPFLREREMVK